MSTTWTWPPWPVQRSRRRRLPARGLGPAEISALSVAILGSGGMTALLASLRDWLHRGHAAPRTVRLEIDGDVIVLENADAAERSELLRNFLSRHGIQEPA